jgi:hypothetical protein
MPFDGSHNPAELDIAVMKAAVRQARLEGRLICDNPGLFRNSAERAKRKGVTYVCAIGAIDEHHERHPLATYDGRKSQELCCALIEAHDELFYARKRRNLEAIRRTALKFARLIAA